MCGFGASLKILRGLDGIKSTSLSVIFLTTLVCCTRGSSSSTLQGLTDTGRLFGMREHLERTTDRSEDFNNEDVVLLSHSGDPWGSRNESKGSRNSQIQSSTSNTTATRSSLTVGHSGHRRPKRSVAHLYNMVVCATGCNPISYKGYGCYCGFLGSGTAVDGIDQCCRMHDRCYDATECPTFLEYFVPYYWKCYRGYRPICAVEHGKWGGSGSCAQRLCECDRALSECLRRFPCPTSKAVCTTSPWRLIQNVFMIF